jgi:uncharacterized protein (TIGR03435 family)
VRDWVSGEFDIQLDFTPDSGRGRTAGGFATDASGLPSIYTALEQQLSPKLESGKGAVELVIIDRVEKTSEN